MLELTQHVSSAFITLTYDDENLPHNLDGFAVLCKRDVQLFLKRLRKRYPKPIRYFFAGEYGEKTWRPHYHAIIYGIDISHPTIKLIQECWPYGFIMVGDVTMQSAQYVAGYVSKKFLPSKKNFPLGSEYAEFILSSRRPGIGAVALESLYSDIQIYNESSGKMITSPTTLNIDGKTFPLGRFLREKLDKIDGGRIFTDPPLISPDSREYALFRHLGKAELIPTGPDKDYYLYRVNQTTKQVERLEFIHRLYNKRDSL